MKERTGILPINVRKGETLLDALREMDLAPVSICGGNRTCGKCRVRILDHEGNPLPVSDEEKRLLSAEDILGGIRLACCQMPEGTVYLTESVDACKANEPAKASRKDELNHGIYMKAVPGSFSENQTASHGFGFDANPWVSSYYLEMDEPALDDSMGDLERLQRALEQRGAGKVKVPLKLLRALPDILRRSDFRVTAVVDNCSGQLIELAAGEPASHVYGVAFDIGTTTVAGYLVDLSDKRCLDAQAMLNPQSRYGGDVITRIQYTMEKPDGRGQMQLLIVDCMNQIIETLCRRAGILHNNIYALTVVGNTTMLHFLLRLPAGNIALTPFIPVSCEQMMLDASQLGLKIHQNGIVCLLNSISSYIGADTVAAILSSNIHREDEISLLVDIGTNGEIVLGNRNGLFSCSAAAGPAFEGAHIRNGVAGTKGAICSIRLDENLNLITDTIGDVPAIGICGSGVIDAVALMLEYGIIDETGRFIGSKESGFTRPRPLEERILEPDEENPAGFLLKKAGETAIGSDIVFTQKDIREVQLAKAAIGAGIRILAKKAGIGLDQVQRVYLAGGFGSFVNSDHALEIGLIPGELSGRITAVGNAAGEGAVMALLSADKLKEAAAIKDIMKYVELSACPEFQEEFVENMLFKGVQAYE